MTNQRKPGTPASTIEDPQWTDSADGAADSPWPPIPANLIPPHPTNGTASTRPMRMLVVWCPDWPVIAAAAAAGAPPLAPVAVVLANRILACSATARARGVRRGMRRREAQGCCTDLLVFVADPDRDERSFEPVAAAVEELAPGVEVVRPGLVAVPARGPAGYFGGEEAAAERLVDQVASRTGVECQIGVADGLFAAVLAAHRGVLVPAGGSPAFLAPRPVNELAEFIGQVGLDRTGPNAVGRNNGKGADGRRQVSAGLIAQQIDLVDLLRRLGLRTLGAFAALSENEVASRFGADAVLAHRLAGGVAQRPPDRRSPPPELMITQVLDPPADRVDAVAFAARTAAQRLHELLGSYGLACTRLAIDAETEHGERHSRVWRCAEPLTVHGIADRVRWQLDGWLRTARLRSGVCLLRLWPEEVVDGRSLQLELFAGGGATAADDERAARALLRVQSLLGPEGVFTPLPDGGRGPAERVNAVAWGDERVARFGPELPWPGQLVRPAPSTVPVDPPPARVLDERGEQVTVTEDDRLTARPVRVVVGGKPRSVLGWAGPWVVDRQPSMAGGALWLARVQVLLAGEEAAERKGELALLLRTSGDRWLVEGIYD
jgi:protein ImuB